MTERQQMRNKRVDDMVKLILIRDETRNMSIEDATKAIENHLSSGYEGKKEKELFIEKLTARKCSMNVVISLQFADTINQKSKNKILKNVMDSLVNTVEASGIVYTSSESRTQTGYYQTNIAILHYAKV